MSGQRVWQDRNAVVQADEVFTSPSVSVPNTGVDTEICRLQVRWGNRCWLVGLASIIDAGGVGFATFSLRKNFTPFYPFAYATSQWGSITNPLRMMNAYQIEQGSLLSITCNMAGATGSMFAAGRIMVEYEDF